MSVTRNIIATDLNITSDRIVVEPSGDSADVSLEGNSPVVLSRDDLRDFGEALITMSEEMKP